MENCLGCLLTQEKLTIYKVYETEHIIVFLDHEPFTDGHLLILPKQHRKEVTELTAKEQTDIQQTIQLLSNVVNQLVKPDGISIIQNGGIFDELTHVHIHIVPRFQHQHFAEFYLESEGEFTPDAPRLQRMQQSIIGAIQDLA